jgi:1-acyl-sn-glycerol-3-phosphate acyltransferase
MGSADKFAPCALILSPKGSIANRPWRTGYYYIAQECRVPIIAAIIDWHKGIVRFSEPISSENPIEQVEKEIKKAFALGLPLVHS